MQAKGLLQTRKSLASAVTSQMQMCVVTKMGIMYIADEGAWEVAAIIDHRMKRG